MAGLINEARQEQAPNEGGAQDLPTPEKVQEGLTLPPNLQEPYQRVVVAGMKVMFSKETHSMMIEQLQGEGPMGQKLGEGIAGLMLLLFQQSNKTLPPQLLIPAGAYLMAQAADYVKKSGQPISAMDMAQGMEVMVETLFTKFGVDPAKVLASAGGAQGQPQSQPQPQPAQGA